MSSTLELIKQYTQAQQTIIKTLSQRHISKTNADYQKAVLSKINDTLRDLINDSKLWSNKEIPRQYKKAVNKAVNDYKRMNIDIKGFEGLSDLHNAQINVLLQNTINNFTVTNSFIGRTINDEVRKITMDTFLQARLTGRSIGSIRDELITRLADKNVTKNLEAYVNMITRTVLTETENQAIITHLKANDKDLVKMSSHPTSCKICAPLQGRVYSISGTSTEYPPLKIAFSGNHANIHPNCRHYLIPYEPSKDINADKTKQFSNRSFDIDPRSKKQIDDYNKEQKLNYERNRDRKQWERYKMVLPKDAPKTLSSFRRIKKNNTKQWIELQEKFSHSWRKMREGEKQNGL